MNTYFHRKYIALQSSTESLSTSSLLIKINFFSVTFGNFVTKWLVGITLTVDDSYTNKINFHEWVEKCIQCHLKDTLNKHTQTC